MARCGADLVLFHNPVIVVVMVESESVKCIGEEVPQQLVVRLVFELQSTAIVDILVNLVGQTFAQGLNGGGRLLISNLIVLELLALGRDTLPRELAFEEIHQDETHALEVVSTTLLNTQMCVD